MLPSRCGAMATDGQLWTRLEPSFLCPNAALFLIDFITPCERLLHFNLAVIVLSGDGMLRPHVGSGTRGTPSGTQHVPNVLIKRVAGGLHNRARRTGDAKRPCRRPAGGSGDGGGANQADPSGMLPSADLWHLPTSFATVSRSNAVLAGSG